MKDLKFSLGSCTPRPTDAATHQRLLHYYRYWRSKYLQDSQQVAGGRYVDYQDKHTTCSEAQGYGMLISVYLSTLHDTRTDFDALNTYRKQYRSHIDPRLMAWYVDDTQARHEPTTCATDGDLDIAYALILAAYRWQAPVYLVEAWDILAGIEASLIRPDFTLRRGDWDQEQHAVRLSDIMPSHFTAFARVSNTAGLWEKVKAAHYAILQQVAGQACAFPDFVVKTKQGWQAAPPNYLEGDYDGMMYYNACRVPWRLAAAAVETGDPAAAHLLQVFGGGIGKVANQGFMAGYTPTGQCLNEWTDGAFTAPHMCSLLVNQRVGELQQAIQQQFTQQEMYYQDSIRLLSLCLVTGNTFTLVKMA